MRRTGHIRQRSRNSWELRYSLGTDPATGRRRVVTTTLSGDRKAAERELRRVARTLARNRPPRGLAEVTRAIYRNCHQFPDPGFGQPSAHKASPDPYPKGLQRM